MQLTELPVVRTVVGWWSRPSARDRILKALLELEGEGATPAAGLTLVTRAQIGRGLIYSRLFYLEEDGLVGHEVLVPASEGRLQQLGYVLTDKGRRAAQRVMFSHRDRVLATLLDLEQSGDPESSGLAVGISSNLGAPGLYLGLRQLEGEGLIDHRVGPPQENRGGRPGHFYRLTEQGREKAKTLGGIR